MENRYILNNTKNVEMVNNRGAMASKKNIPPCVAVKMQNEL